LVEVAKSLALVNLFLSGTKQLLKVMSAFYVIRRDHLPSIFLGSKPGVPFST
jgi:hypothetical protein